LLEELSTTLDKERVYEIRYIVVDAERLHRVIQSPHGGATSDLIFNPNQVKKFYVS